ncbi:hypothetical protein [Maliponia aquimaris]|uniref:Uncharacterized protein n=1 Tax=Maliponia aquimaris TaxID=1673631 RepID=A0A238JRT0_9RHOB|nr:hypothetical protein [Maliponia aquimaris]SMX33388.1 hypothetical protein MAA8898_00455 [Maliponia aquimaris]
MSAAILQQWSVTLEVTLDPASGAASLRDWLEHHSGACSPALPDQLCQYLLAQLISTSDWDHVALSFEVARIAPALAAAQVRS